MRKILPIICICLSLTACFENKEDKTLINEKIAQFLDINKIANATSRMNLVLPLSKMQEIQSELKNLKLSSPCKELQKDIVTHMDTILSVYISFAAERNDVPVIFAKLAIDDLSELTELQSCGEYNKQLEAQKKAEKEKIARNKHFNDKKWWEKATSKDILSEIKKGADVNTTDNEDKISPLMMVLKYSVNKLENLSTLVENGADVKSEDSGYNTLLHIAIQSNVTPEIIKRLIDVGNDVNTINGLGNTPLHEASASNSSSDVIKTLVTSGANINAKDRFGGTPLHKASSSNMNPDIIKTLVELGANINAKNSLGNTPLLNACKFNTNAQITKILIDLGANINFKDNLDNTLLHEASASNSNADVIKTLVASGANINAKDGFGDTPLHEACATNENPEIIKTLIDFGADVNARNNAGKTPLAEVGQQKNKSKIIQLLREHGAKY